MSGFDSVGGVLARPYSTDGNAETVIQHGLHGETRSRADESGAFTGSGGCE
jgi:hypothetical protein